LKLMTATRSSDRMFLRGRGTDGGWWCERAMRCQVRPEGWSSRDERRIGGEGRRGGKATETEGGEWHGRKTLDLVKHRVTLS
jgi:hypothetical protein